MTNACDSIFCAWIHPFQHFHHDCKYLVKLSLSLSWCSGSMVGWLCPHFFSNQFSFCYTTSQVMKIFTLIPINPFPLNSAQGLLQHFSCQPTHACEQSHNSSRKQNFRCLTLTTRQMQQQTPSCPGYPLEWAIFWSKGCQPPQIIQVCPPKCFLSLTK